MTLDRPFAESSFQLFDLEVDPGEANDLSEVEPERFTSMLELWREQREELGIIPLEER